MNILTLHKKNIARLLLLIIISTLPLIYFTNKAQANVGASAVGIAAGCLASSLVGVATNALSVPVADRPAEQATGATAWKNCFLDGAAILLRESVIQKIEEKTYNWINRGFQGKPSYGANLEQMFKNNKAKILDDLIYNNKNLQGLCTGFEIDVKFALQSHFFRTEKTAAYQPKCTIDDLLDVNAEAETAIGNKKYSWKNFLDITTNPDNNAFGSYFNIVSSTQEQIDKADARIQLDYDINSGFLSYRKCSSEYIAQRGKEGKPGIYDATDPRANAGCPVTTPGISIFEKLTETLGTEIKQLIAADEFDEIIGTVVQYYVTNALTESDEGVRGFTESGSYQSGLDAALAENLEALNDYKDTISAQYDERVYDVAIKIVESKLKTIQNAQVQYNKTHTCWNTKDGILNSGFQLFAIDQIDSQGNTQYMELTKNTTNGTLSFLNPLASKFASDIQKAYDDIAFLETQKEKALAIQDAIADITDAAELSKIGNAAGVEPVDVADHLSLRDESNRYYDELVNGESQGYDTRGKEIVKGGFITSHNYCSRFSIQQDPEKEETETYTPITASQVSIGNVNTIDATGNITVIDIYDPSADLQDIKDNPASVSSDGNSCSIQVAGSSKSINLENRKVLILRGYVKESNSCSSKRVTFTCSDGSLSNDFSGSSASFYTEKSHCDAGVDSSSQCTDAVGMNSPAGDKKNSVYKTTPGGVCISGQVLCNNKGGIFQVLDTLQVLDNENVWWDTTDISKCSGGVQLAEINTFEASEVTENSVNFQAAYKYSGFSNPKIFVRYGKSATNLNLTSEYFRPTFTNTNGWKPAFTIPVDSLEQNTKYYFQPFIEDNANFIINPSKIIAEGAVKEFTTLEGEYENKSNLNVAQLSTRAKLLAAGVVSGGTRFDRQGSTTFGPREIYIGSLNDSGTGSLIIKVDLDGSVKARRNGRPFIQEGSGYVLGQLTDAADTMTAEQAAEALSTYFKISAANRKDLFLNQWMIRRTLIDLGMITENHNIGVHSARPTTKYFNISGNGNSIGLYLSSGFYAYSKKDGQQNPLVHSGGTNGNWFFDRTINNTGASLGYNADKMYFLQDHLLGKNDSLYEENSTQNDLVTKLFNAGVFTPTSTQRGYADGSFVRYRVDFSKYVFMDRNGLMYIFSSNGRPQVKSQYGSLTHDDFGSSPESISKETLIEIYGE